MAVQTQSQLRSELLDRLIFETLLTDISARFVNLPFEQVDSEIELAQKGICECLGLDHSSLWQLAPDGTGKIILTHYYRAALDLPLPPDNMDGFQFFPWALDRLSHHQTVCIPDISQAPPEAAIDVQNWQHFRLQSTFAIPLAAGGGPILGIISFDSTRRTREWPDVLQARLQLIAQVFANALQHKNAEQRLRESEARLGLAAQSANAGLWTLNPRTGELWATEKTIELLGLPPGGRINLEIFLRAVKPADRPATRAIIEQALRSGEESTIEYRITGRDGAVHWLLARGRRHPVQQDLLLGLVSDITETKRLQRERAEFAARLLNAQETESARIARELHDDLGQALALFAVQLHKTSLLVQSQAPGAEAPLHELRSRITQIAQRVSTLSHQLHSSELDLLGLVAAAKALCRDLAQQHGVKIDFVSPALPPLSRDVEICLFRVLQEALNNFLKHSQGTHARVELKRSRNTVRLGISDNGVGFDRKPSAARPGLGLISMQERMRIVNGTLVVKSEPGQGTRIEASARIARQSLPARR
jgi:PAS domain S-box-containing protein